MTIPSSRVGRKGSVDGFVMLSSLPPSQGAAVIEVKNIREWIYPMELMLWDIIRNGFVVDAVPMILESQDLPFYVYICTVSTWRIQDSAHNQFLPIAMEPALVS